jgi:hypothetical protein
MTTRDARHEAVKKDVTRLVDHARRWVASEEGRRQIEASQKSAMETTERLQEARRVDPKALREPMVL